MNKNITGSHDSSQLWEYYKRFVTLDLLLKDKTREIKDEKQDLFRDMEKNGINKDSFKEAVAIIEKNKAAGYEKQDLIKSYVKLLEQILEEN
jgi:uncharacterized protein (UPF0335 family)